MAKRPKPDKPVLWVVRRPQGLVAATPYDLEQIERYRLNTRLSVTIEQPKDERLERFFHAMVNKVAKAIGEEPESLKWWLKLEAGLRREVNIQIDGSTSFIPKSLTEIEQDELQAFVDRATEIICTRLIPGATVEDIMNETLAHLGEPNVL